MTLALGIVQEQMNVLLLLLRILHTTCKYVVLNAETIRKEAELTEICHMPPMTLALGIAQEQMNALLSSLRILHTTCKYVVLNTETIRKEAELTKICHMPPHDPCTRNCARTDERVAIVA